jgi:pyruvate kinase
MKQTTSRVTLHDMHDRTELNGLIQQLDLLRSEMVSAEAAGQADIEQVSPEHIASAKNLLHYMALRRHDIRDLQIQLASLGLSSLGRTESRVIDALQDVINVLAKLAGDERDLPGASESIPELCNGQNLPQAKTDALLGPAPEDRRVRIMVTMPPEAATDYDLVLKLLLNGMNCMRINCAHDGPEAWRKMIQNLRRAQQETGKSCKVAMDVAGPKLRTGPIEPGPCVLKYRPKRDIYGRVESPARIWLTPTENPEIPPSPAALVPVPGKWLSELRAGRLIRFTDARGANRSMKVEVACGNSRWAEALQTAYLMPGTVLTVEEDFEGESSGAGCACIGPIPAVPQTLRLNSGDRLVLTRSFEPGKPAHYDEQLRLIRPASIGVCPPEFFDYVRIGEPIWFDDGRIGGTIASVAPDEVVVEITQARPGGEKLGAEKGINVPETDLCLPSLTPEDLKNLRFIVEHADIVGYSFVRTEEDVQELQARLAELNGQHLGIILKIETRKGFDNLPRLLVAAMRTRAVGVMIARGDLAVECGYQRLAEVQEEILWICEAAHMPVIWATQVLESLAKSGITSRSEITDAAMGERAECVMLNKGPYIVEAVRALDDILRRMEAHQDKKRSMLRRLHVAGAMSAASGQ